MKQSEYNVSRLIKYCNLFDETILQGKIEDLENIINYINSLVKVYTSVGLANVPWTKTYEIAQQGINFGLTQPSQGTQEWLNQRLNRISASDIGSALGENKYKEPDIVIIDKCGYPNQWWWDPVTSVKFTHHGHKYEFIASQIHEIDHGVKCYEASFIPHPTIDFIGASPDKFALDSKNKRGYLVEIKCPYLRYPKICAIPKQYWIQMQVQLEVTNLEEAYFEDCRIMEYPNEFEFLTNENPPKHQGVIGELHDLVGENTIYIYPKLRVSEESVAEMNERMKNEIKLVVDEYKSKSERYHFIGFKWWKLTMHQSILVLRDRQWFAEMLPKLDAFWKKVLWHRENGYDEIVKKYNQPTLAELKSKK